MGGYLWITERRSGYSSDSASYAQDAQQNPLTPQTPSLADHIQRSDHISHPSVELQ
jgi:hypothetical protein